MKYIDIVFDGPPGPEAGRFVEVENELGASVDVGEWMDRGDGLWALRIKKGDNEDPWFETKIARYMTEWATGQLGAGNAHTVEIHAETAHVHFRAARLHGLAAEGETTPERAAHAGAAVFHREAGRTHLRAAVGVSAMEEAEERAAGIAEGEWCESM